MSELRCAVAALALALAQTSGAQDIHKVSVEPNRDADALHAELSKDKVTQSDNAVVSAPHISMSDVEALKAPRMLAQASQPSLSPPPLTALSESPSGASTPSAPPALPPLGTPAAPEAGAPGALPPLATPAAVSSTPSGLPALGTPSASPAPGAPAPAPAAEAPAASPAPPAAPPAPAPAAPAPPASAPTPPPLANIVAPPAPDAGAPPAAPVASPAPNVVAPPPAETMALPPATAALAEKAAVRSAAEMGAKPLKEEAKTFDFAPPAPAAAAAMAPRLTPRGAAVTLYPAPAVTPRPQAGILGPYGPGLAAAAPVGTPYLRSPAFAGPPIIYMPQTVTRVLLPGLTPYPSNVMHPPAQYVYSSAPFTRTDIYVDLPYGTFYWPQGYAGTAPVEPQVPAYVVSPSQALMTNEASNTTQRYSPGIAHPETISPVSQALGPEPGAAGAPVPGAGPEMMPPAPGAAPAGAAPGVVSKETTVQVAPSAAITPTPEISGAMPTPAPGAPLPEGVSPFSAEANTAAASTPAPGAQKPGIEVDDSTPGGLVTEPANAWLPSHNPIDSYNGSSLVATVDGKTKTASFVANVPEDGEYEVYLWWVAANPDFRSNAVPVTINTASGPVKATIDQTKNGRQWNLVGSYAFKAGQQQKVVTLSTEGIPAGTTMNVSVDAMKMVKVR